MHINEQIEEKKELKKLNEVSNVEIERPNMVYAIIDGETGDYVQAFVVSNKIQAQRNLDVAKVNLKKIYGEDSSFIEKLELKKLKEF